MGQGPAVDGSEELAWALQDQMAAAFQELWEPDWYDRGVKRGLLPRRTREQRRDARSTGGIGLHDNAIDVEYLKDPFAWMPPGPCIAALFNTSPTAMAFSRFISLNRPPTSMLNTEAGLNCREPGSYGAPFGAPTSYLVQTSDGFYWSEGLPTTETRLLLDTAVNETVYARVIAVNDGGRSFASEVVGGLRSADGTSAVLIVDAFDRFAAGQLFAEDVHPRIGWVDRLEPHRVNPHDIVVPHGIAVQSLGWPFDSVSDEALDALELSNYRVVIWATGEESTIDETVSTTQQASLQQFWETGGALFISGAEVLWDLDYKGSETDQAFAATVLGATLEADDANSTEAMGVGILEGLDLSFPDNTSPYPIEWPDVL